MRAAGAVLVVVGGALTARSVLLLHGRGRPRRGPLPPFVIAGPYRRMRNPLLAGLLVAAIGAAVFVRSVVLLCLAVGAGLTAHAWVVGVEEPRLSARFGDAYAAYRRFVPRWMPGRSRRDEDST